MFWRTEVGAPLFYSACPCYSRVRAREIRRNNRVRLTLAARRLVLVMAKNSVYASYTYDPVGAISVHGVVGIFGLMIVPLTNDGTSFAAQALGAVVIFAWVFGASLVVWLLIKLIFGIRISEEEEYEGADVRECGMEAYPEFTK